MPPTPSPTADHGHLILQRRRGEAIIIGADILVRVIGIDPHRVLIGVQAPDGTRIREESDATNQKE